MLAGNLLTRDVREVCAVSSGSFYIEIYTHLNLIYLRTGFRRVVQSKPGEIPENLRHLGVV
jgi:hypothetical protein